MNIYKLQKQTVKIYRNVQGLRCRAPVGKLRNHLRRRESIRQKIQDVANAYAQDYPIS